MLKNEDISNNTLISSGAFVHGDVKAVGFVRVEGDVDGNLETSGNLIVTDKARIRGNVTARSSVIGGIVQGNVVSPEGVNLLSTSAVLGDIATRRLQIADGVVFHGHCISLKNQDKYNAAFTQYEDKKMIQARSIMSPFFSETD